MAEEIDQSQQTPADYTVQIDNMPTDATDQEIKEYFETVLLKEFDGKVEKVVRSYYIGEYIEL